MNNNLYTANDKLWYVYYFLFWMRCISKGREIFKIILIDWLMTKYE